ncbi:MAG TPA: mechanosensitive ion channel family protein [Candidatus Poseidoniales archaeon]|jgi:small-conductance mechanosensitive channel|nr:MAG TPA: mechanosensitive ion channel family protein [Candidatus Poseidoniales archaeon]HIH57096.1 mechanosensitive ion channel family protein [Candidatus Poseidoniaceae archaeon]|tara:strand:+ start:3420 stop:4724 length:1305 start_codon:yes stop_codon:yes gene_type:complete
MSQVEQAIDWLNELDPWAQWGVGIVSTFMALGIVRLFMKKVVLDFVKKTEVKWDDMLYAPVSKRAYLFTFLLGIQLTMNWVLGIEDSFVESFTPFFEATYIIISTSLLSVALRIMIPVIMDTFSDPTSVTVSGSNSLIIFVFRAAVWFGGLYLALSELGIELFGVLASLAVFSLIIGLAMQQTLGNIVNSFMLALDQPFEVGDRIEVEGKMGSVVSVGILSTKILTHEENLVVIPNNSLVNSTVINHARGGGDGVGRRISLVQDIGVGYDEDISHVKYTVLQLMRKCPYVLPKPEPRVLLIELGDFAKVFRMYGWVEDYSDEYVARDWLLKNIDEQFKSEGIEIPFPTSVEISGKASPGLNKSHKIASVRKARLQMVKEDKQLNKERAAAKEEIEAITEKLKDTDLDKKTKALLEEDLRELNSILSMFEAGGDD